MKGTGIVRRIDEMGRVVLPKEIRRTLTINESDSLEIYVEGNEIILNKYSTEESIINTLENLDEILQEHECKLGILKTQELKKLIKDMKEILIK
jgi:transcriptional pleiotropic regulator of transition state genes